MSREINSTSNNLIKELLKLKRKKYIYENNQFLIEGKNNLIRANELNFLHYELYIDEKYLINPNNQNNIKVTPEILKKISQLETNFMSIGVSAFPDNYYIIKKNNTDIEKWKEKLKQYKKIAVLDGVSNPGNLGNIIRSAVAFNIDAIFLVNDAVDIFNSKVISATQGSFFDIDIYKFDEMPNEILSYYQQLAFYLDRDAKQLTLKTHTKFSENVALIFGNEAHGLDITKYSNELEKIYIPINSKIESLSVVNAAAIAFFYFDNLLK